MRITSDIGKTTRIVSGIVRPTSPNPKTCSTQNRSVKFYEKLSRKMAYALRHNPEGCGLVLDTQGRTPIEKLLNFLNSVIKNENITIADIAGALKASSKKRFELKGDKIRAYYGHSFAQKLVKEPKTPPEILYHGTSHEAAEKILKEGLTHQRRQYVHLSTNIDTAVKVGMRKDKNPVMLVIDTSKAKAKGIHFYRGNNSVWMSDDIPADCISLIS